MRKSVLIRAPLLSSSGYGVHSRQIFKWLLTQPVDVHVQIVNWGQTTWLLNKKAGGEVVEEIMKRSVSENNTPFCDYSFQVQLPNEWSPKLARKNIGVSAWVETDICSPTWIEAANKMDALVVPSAFTAEVIKKSGQILKPLFVVPEAYIESVAKKNVKPIDLNLTTSFNFLFVGTITGASTEVDRKNILNTIKLFCEEFKDDKDVGLILKTSFGRSTAKDREHTLSFIRNQINLSRPGNTPKIYVLHGQLREDEVSAIYRDKRIKALVAPTRGEGYGLPLLEAAVSKLPVITTNWSGHLDFLKKGKFIPLKYTLKEIPPSKIDNNIFVQGAKWAHVDGDDFKKKLRAFREKSNIPQKWANELSETLKPLYSQRAINKIYDVFFEKIK